jgi:hypothetical protein
MISKFIIVFIVYCLYTCNYAYKINNNRIKINRLSSRLYNKNSVLDFPDYYDEPTRITKNILEFNEYETLYTLIWYKCSECDKLLNDIKDAKLKILYIDGSYYFFDDDDVTNTPILYKNDILVATDVFDIYGELFT